MQIVVKKNWKKEMQDNPNIEGNCQVENCNRPLHRKTGHILYNANTDRYDAICKFCFLENPSYGRKIKKVIQTN